MRRSGVATAHNAITAAALPQPQRDENPQPGKGSALPLYKTVFVAYPRGLRSGGPEALHQLVHSLRTLGQEAYLTPIPGSRAEPRVHEYDHYDAPERPFEDSPECALVAPETSLAQLFLAKKAARICWWLSIDASPLFAARRRRIYQRSFSPAERIEQGVARGRGAAYRLAMHKKLWKDTFHLAQSHYAWNFLYDHFDVTPSLVTDYTPAEQIGSLPRRSIEERGPTIAYNPRKGGWAIEELRRNGAPYDFVPLENMPRGEVLRTLCATAVYLDLGHHPGKDRMPREAALAGALTLVSRQGSAANSLDVPIPWEHKIDVKGDVVKNASTLLEAVFADLAGHKSRQDGYEDFIRREQQRFQAEVAGFFVHGKYGSDLPGDRLTIPGGQPGEAQVGPP